MPGIGETLREARMRQRLDIADVEQRTKIRAKYLRALENEEFGMLPGPTFVKTFLRTYAEMLGLDPHVLVDEYRANYEGEDELDAQPLGPPTALSGNRGRRSWMGPGMLALLAVVAVVAVLAVIGLVTGEGDDTTQAGRTETTPQQTTTHAKKKKKKKQAAPPTSVAVRVVPVTPTYVCVDRGLGTPVLFEGTIDGAETFRGKRVRLNLGKRDVQIWSNGKRVAVTPGPDPVGYDMTPKATHELPLGTRPCA